jgi:DNA-binding winged helix-turn-helix (wHTH) protein
MEQRPETTRIIRIDDSGRCLIATDGQSVALPALSYRLLQALAAANGRYITPAELLDTVWPHPHYSVDTVKQRVRLLRRALGDAGYPAEWLDSVRGEGYALLAELKEADGGEVGTAVRRKPSWRRRYLAAGLVVIVAAVLALAGREQHAPLPERPSPLPVRVAILASPSSTGAEQLVTELARLPHVLMIPVDTVEACVDPQRVHLCLRTSTAPDMVSWDLIQAESGAILLQTSDDALRDAQRRQQFLVQASLLASPGVMRWLGGRTGAGDPHFSYYREALRQITRCGSQADGILPPLQASGDSAPNFAHAQAAQLWLEAGVDRSVPATVKGIEKTSRLLTQSPDLALAHLALALRYLDAKQPVAAETHLAAGIRLLPSLSTTPLSWGAIRAAVSGCPAPETAK